MSVHLGLEKPNRRSALAFGPIESAISTPDQLARNYSIIRGYGNSNAYAEAQLIIVDQKLLRRDYANAPRQICRIVQGFNTRHDDRKLVASNSGKDGIGAEN